MHMQKKNLLFFAFSCIIGCLNKRKSKGFNKIFILSGGKMSTNLAVRTILMKYFAIKCNLKNLHKIGSSHQKNLKFVLDTQYTL
jgi:hypothetical protein